MPNTLITAHITLMPLTKGDIDYLSHQVGNEISDNSRDTTINEGDIVMSPQLEVEGIEFPQLLFRVVGTIREYKGVPINSYILKEVVSNGNEFVYPDVPSNRQKLTMSKAIASNLGIEWQSGLELWPMSHGFYKFSREQYRVVYKSNDQYTDRDMGTYPCDENTGLVTKICILINDLMINKGNGIIHFVGDDHRLKGMFINYDMFIKRLRIHYNSRNGGIQVPWKIIVPEIGMPQGSIPIEVDLSDHNVTREDLTNRSLQEVLSASLIPTRRSQMATDHDALIKAMAMHVDKRMFIFPDILTCQFTDK